MRHGSISGGESFFHSTREGKFNAKGDDEARFTSSRARYVRGATSHVSKSGSDTEKFNYEEEGQPSALGGDSRRSSRSRTSSDKCASLGQAEWPEDSFSKGPHEGKFGNHPMERRSSKKRTRG